MTTHTSDLMKPRVLFSYPPKPPTLSERLTLLWKLVPGLVLTTGLALLSTVLHEFPGLNLFSTLILSVLLGMGIRNILGLRAEFRPGIQFSLKRILRLAIILLGLRLSLDQLAAVGPLGLGIVAITLIATFLFTCWLGRALGLRESLVQLIAAGTSICGASAVVATGSVVEGSDEDVAYAVAIVTVFGTASMLIYPLIEMFVHLGPKAFGIWCGSSIHEVAQVVAAAFQSGEISGEFATISKLSRVLFLVPVLLFLSSLTSRKFLSHRGPAHSSSSRLPIPWFVFGFMVLVLLNSLNLFPSTLTETLTTGNKFLLGTALAAMGLETSLVRILKIGLKPLYLGAASWIFISIFSLGLVVLLPI